MKRILFGGVLVALLALAVSALGQTPKHHAAVAAPAAAVSAHAACPVSDPSKCPAGCYGSGAKVKAMDATIRPSSEKAQQKVVAAACPGVDPAGCPAWCRKSGTDAAAQRVASR